MYYDNLIYTYVVTPFAFVALAFTIVIILVLFRIDKESRVFVFLKFESMFIFIDILMNTLLPLFVCSSCFPEVSPLLRCLLYTVCFRLISSIAELSSMIMGIFSAISLYFMFKVGNTTKFQHYLQGTNPLVIAFASLCLSFAIFSIDIWIFFDLFNLAFENSTNLNCHETKAEKSAAYFFTSIFMFGLSYGLSIITFVIINIMLIFKARKKFSNNTDAISSTSKRKRKEINLLKIVLADSINLILSRVPLIIFYSFSGGSIDPFVSLVILIIIISFIVKFFLFFLFNNRFRAEVRNILKKIFLFKISEENNR